MIPTRRQFINRAPYRIHDCLDILVEFLISEADELKTTRGKPGGAPLVMLDGDRIQVLRAIELDDKLVGEANEINNVRANGGLTAELPAAQLLSAKEVPQAFFRVGGLVAQRAGEVALVRVAVHGCGLPPP